jgi:hypothetical protein
LISVNTVQRGGSRRIVGYLANIREEFLNAGVALNFVFKNGNAWRGSTRR